MQVQPEPVAEVGAQARRETVLDPDLAAGRILAGIGDRDGVGRAGLSLGEVARVRLGDAKVRTQSKNFRVFGRVVARVDVSAARNRRPVG